MKTVTTTKKTASKKAPFSEVTIIFNPNSTGNGKALAKQLQADLQQQIPKLSVTITPTKYAGHAEKLAYKLAKDSRRPLIISASGDGGYHEIINGMLRANAAGAQAVAGLLPAGNANDHYHMMHDEDTIEAIRQAKVNDIDVLKLSSVVSGQPFERYAHSYIGIGLTPKVGQELNKQKLNAINEIGIVLRALFFLHPIKVIIDNHTRTYDSVIFSNIRKMSKVLAISETAKTDDGMFEVTAFKRRNKLSLISALLRASTLGLRGSKKVSNYQFKTIKPLLVQLDGEIFTIDAQAEVTITIDRQRLPCII